MPFASFFKFIIDCLILVFNGLITITTTIFGKLFMKNMAADKPHSRTEHRLHIAIDW